MLPQIRGWLKQLLEERKRLESCEKRLKGLLAPGRDLGGELVNAMVRSMAELQSIFSEFYGRELQIKDLDRGLIDFPSMMGGREVFLCWENGEDDVEFWHELDSGYAGRERLSDD